ncbi:MAG TPA: type I glyceraldehyde-3-phosphate dehydrogenase [Candidatus Bathyarchaeota archaeon]|nr:MAG: type I glyceraldehyde-3-phosphate dehydrogenase [Candidatus Bathyarchaeota archaeon]RLI28004.1 MAG: type I glyceraldehyde-3-phosphate dehydrogenase [Candidatus Bathyarchaeota archaeon]HDI07076.1 type I glyceraldehyde-3-phosphate dehydrogenase [Candidatus Bathyarchaeota archaeon]
MAAKVAINGFGRIGRLLFRAALETGTEIDFAVVNDLTDAKTLAFLLKHDTVHGPLPFDVEAKEDVILIKKNGVVKQELKVLAQPDPAKLPWADMGVYLAVESTGRFRKREDAAKHLQAGAKKVLVSAPMRPAPSADLTVVYGVNDNMYDPDKHHIISLASCTTNCIAPVAKVLNDKFGIRKGLMTTVHSVTNDQRLLDMQHRDLRRARSAAFNIIPTTTGAAVAATLTLPELEGRMNGLALRVPTPTVSIVDFTAELEREVTKEEVNAAFKEAAEGELKGILGYTEEPLVSSDFIHDPRSAIVDGLSTMVIGNLVKVLAWYDNEWGYSVKMVRMIEKICRMAK